MKEVKIEISMWGQCLFTHLLGERRQDIEASLNLWCPPSRSNLWDTGQNKLDYFPENTPFICVNKFCTEVI